MRFRKLLIAATLGLVLTGCTAVSSLQPPYADKDVAAQPSLAGIWDEDKGCDENPMLGVKVIPLKGPGGYTLSVPDQEESRKGWTESYDLHVFRLHDFYFVDASFSHLTTGDGAEFSKNDLPPVYGHYFARIWIDGDHVRLGYIDGDALREAIESKQVRLQQQQIGTDAIILTGSTEEIQGFLLQNADKKEIFPEKDDSRCGFTRRPGSGKQMQPGN